MDVPIYASIGKVCIWLSNRATDAIIAPFHCVPAARMFVRQPKLLVFDDLSSALEVNTERELWNRLRGSEGQVPLASLFPIVERCCGGKIRLWCWQAAVSPPQAP